METRNKRQGFTLIELMITIAIVAVLLTLAAPSFVEVLRYNRIQTGADKFYTSLIAARSEAIKRNQHVMLCKSSNGSACTTSGAWDQGWLIFADEDGDDALDAGEPIISAYEALHEGYTLEAGGNFENRVVYRQDGTASGFDTFVLCDDSQDLSAAREIAINIVGRPRMSKTTDDCSP